MVKKVLPGFVENFQTHFEDFGHKVRASIRFLFQDCANNWLKCELSQYLKRFLVFDDLDLLNKCFHEDISQINVACHELFDGLFDKSDKLLVLAKLKQNLDSNHQKFFEIRLILEWELLAIE